MKKLKILILIILFNLVTFKSIQACDLLGVEIGENASTLEFLSSFEEEDIDPNDSVTIFESHTPAFCEDIDCGSPLVKGYLPIDGIICGV